MARRFPFRTAIAGLTALTIATPTIAPVGTVPAAIAQVRDDNSAANKLAFTQQPATVGINSDAYFPVRVPNADGGSVQFYLDNVAQGGPVKVSGDHATIKITSKSYLNHTVTARYVDASGFNPRADVTANFNTPIEGNANQKGSGSASDNEATKYSSKINDKNGTAQNPVVVKPGADITVRGYMTLNSRSVVYDYGLNPAPGATYQSGKTLNPSQTKLKATGNWPGSGLPVNPGFFAIDINPGWTSLGYTGTLSVEGKFKAPTVPGVYYTEIATYKYRTNDTYFLQRLDDSVYRVEAPNLPARNQRTATKVELPANQTFIANQDGEIKANVTTPDAAGDVIFTSGGKEIGRATVKNGVATAKVTFETAGNPDVMAKFVPAPGTNWAESTTSGKVTVNAPAEKTETTLSLGDSPKTGAAGEELTLTAAISPADATGKVQFYDVTDGNETPLGAAVDVSDGKATAPYTPATFGTKNVKAVFTPSDETKFSGSEATWDIDVDKQGVELTLEGSPQTATVGDAITLKATVNPDNVPGTVQFYEVGNGDDNPIGAPVDASSATTTHTPTSAGSKTYKAVFTPNNPDAVAGDDATWNVEVTQKTVALILDAEKDKKAGEEITVTATVDPKIPGTVEFFDNGQSIGSAPVNSEGVATLTDTFTAGNHPLTAVFTPEDAATYNTPDASTNLLVGSRQKKDTTTTLKVDNNEVTLGQSTKVTANVTKGVTGRVMFSDEDGPLGWAEVNNGVATFTYTPRSAGEKNVKGDFVPTGGSVDTHNGSTSDPVQVQVKDSDEALQETTVTLSGPDKAYADDQFALTAVTTPKNATGKVTFYNGDKEIGTVDVNNGRATLPVTEKNQGSYEYKAVFNPTPGSKFAGSESTHTVGVENKPETTITASTTVTQPTTVTESTTVTEPTTVRETETTTTVTTTTETETETTTETKTETTVTTEPTTVTNTKTETTTTTEPTTVRETTTQPTTIRETETKTETTVTTQPTTVTNTKTETTTTTEPTTVKETETKTVTTTTTEPTTVRETTTQPTTVKETETTTETTTTTQPTTVTTTKTEPTTVTTTTTTTQPTTIRETVTETSTATIKETETKTETTTVTTSVDKPTTVRETTTQPTTIRETKTETTSVDKPTTVTETKTETTYVDKPTTVKETETKTETTSVDKPTTVRETTTQPTTVKETETKTTTVDKPTTVKETETKTETATETKTETTSVDKPTTVRETTTVEKPAADKAPAAPAVDASKVVEGEHGREITLTAGTAPGTKGVMVFELTDGTKLGEVPIGRDGTARFTHKFTDPGVYEIQSYVRSEDGVKGDKSVPFTVTVAEKKPKGSSGSGGGNSTSSVGSSKDGERKSSTGSSDNKTALYAGIGVIVTVVLGAIGALLLGHPSVRQFLASIGIRF